MFRMNLFCAVVGSLVTCVFFSFSTTVKAQLIAADSFDAATYNDPIFPGDVRFDESGADGDGMPVVSPGWNDDGDGDPAKWNLGTGNLQWDSGGTLNNGAITYDDDSTGKGKFIGVPAGGFGVGFRAGDRNLDPYQAADTYYMSMLLNTGGLLSDGSGAKQHAMIGFTNNGWGVESFTNDPAATLNPFGLMVGFHGEDADSNPAAAGQVDLVVRARQADVANPILTDTVLLAGDTEDDLSNNTFHVVLKLEVNVDDSPLDRVTYWVNPGDLTSEGTAETTSAATGSFDTLAMNEETDIDRLRIVISSYENRNFFFDETRLAYDFESLRGDLPVSGLEGDYNNDGTVNAQDYTTWRDALNDSVALLNESVTPGVVDEADYLAWQGNFGAELPMGAGALESGASPVSEPATVVLGFWIAGVLGISRGRFANF